MPFKKFYIICEGQNTEPMYFESLVAYYRTSNIQVISVKGAGDPSSIVKKALQVSRGKSKDYSFEKSDEVWAVFI
jgi:hypothetical protein